MNPQWIKSASLNSRKYRNKKVEVDGILFDSKKEANRYMELKLLEKAGEQSCYYVADFVYKEGENIVVEDTKGMRTKDYVIKRKLMLHKYGIRIKEV